MKTRPLVKIIKLWLAILLVLALPLWVGMFNLARGMEAIGEIRKTTVHEDLLKRHKGTNISS